MSSDELRKLPADVVEQLTPGDLEHLTKKQAQAVAESLGGEMERQAINDWQKKEDQAKQRGFESVGRATGDLLDDWSWGMGGAAAGVGGRKLGSVGIAKASTGKWARSTEVMSERAAKYQARFGRKGQVYMLNGVKFDGIKKGVLLEAKGPGYATFVRDGKFRDWFQGAESLLEQAGRQTRAASGAQIEWHFAEQEAADAVRRMFESEGVTGIRVFFTP